MALATGCGFTPLELDLLDRFHARHKHLGFPPVSDIVFKSRQTSGVGSFTYLDHPGDVRMEDGPAGLGTYSQFDADNLQAGASFWIRVEGGKLAYLEIAVNGQSAWDGIADSWTVIDPDTGAIA